MATDRSAVSNQRWTLIVDGKSYKGWQSTTEPEHDLPIGSYTPAGSKSSVVSVGTARATGSYVFSKKYDPDEYPNLDAPRNPGGASAVKHLVDADGRKLGTLRTTTGVIKGASTSGQDATSGDPIMMMVRYEGEIVA